MRRAASAFIALTISMSAASSARADDAACIAASESGLAALKNGKLRDARKQLAACATTACPAEIADECSKRIATINAAMPTLILGVKDSAGNDLLAATVTVDGAELKDAVTGRAVPLDPGEHTITIAADGLPTVTKTLVLRQGEKDRRETVVLLPAVVAPPPPPPSRWNKWRTLSVVTGSVGVVGLALGGAFGAFASSAQSRQKSDCGPGPACKSYAQGLEDYNVATKDAAASTGLLVAGGVLVGAGVVLWFVSPRPGAARAPIDDPPPAGATPPTALRDLGLRFGSVASGTGLSLRGAF